MKSVWSRASPIWRWARAQDLAHLEQRLAHVGQRFDDLNRKVNRRFDDFNQQMLDFRAEMRQMRNWLVRLYGLIVFSFIGAIVLILFRGLIFK